MKGIVYNFKSAEQFNRVANVCKDISIKDSTFKYSIDKEKKEIYIFGDKDQIHKRCTWLVCKADPLKTIVYKVKK